MSSSSSSDVKSTLSKSVSELPGYQINVKNQDILDKDFSLTTVESGDETDALVERWWMCQPDLLEEEDECHQKEYWLSSVLEWRNVWHTVMSWLSSLTLDSISLIHNISDDEKATTVSGPFDNINGWREDHRFMTMGSTLVPMYSTVLDELVIYDQEDQSSSSLKRIIDAMAGTLEDDMPSHVTLSGDETLMKRLDSRYVISQYRKIYGTVGANLWRTQVSEVYSYPHNLANSKEQDTVPTLQQFQQLKTLCFKLNLVSDSLSWILEVTQSWSSSGKQQICL
ncbi:hypothetical protein ARMGADRAFT_1039559 [Armillaria gallica]|uniref:Uncharacterized protein n=1 Tax=Armillaria gallica TaxID=47427 RepID=A0A2H3CY91_ARMGA|nr:hypothetical protein ARMGADRAFT_1039559 [Armillaria gallica]